MDRQRDAHIISGVVLYIDGRLNRLKGRTMKIEDCKVGTKVYAPQRCEETDGCAWPSYMDQYVGKPMTIAWVRPCAPDCLMGRVRVHENSLAWVPCWLEQYTPIEPAAQDWSLEALRAATSQTMDRWVGAKVRVRYGYEIKITRVLNRDPESLRWEGDDHYFLWPDVSVEREYGWDIVAILSPPPQHADSKDAPMPEPETFPGGFKVGDRVRITMDADGNADEFTGAKGTVTTLKRYEENQGGAPFLLECTVPVWLDSENRGHHAWMASPLRLEHLKEEEPKRGDEFLLYTDDQRIEAKKGSVCLGAASDLWFVPYPSEHIPDDASGEMSAVDCLAHDLNSAMDSLANHRRKICLMCGALIDADDWRHEISIECAVKRDRRHLPELPRMRPAEDEE